MKDFTIAYDHVNQHTAKDIAQSLSRVDFRFSHLHTGDLVNKESLPDRMLSTKGVIILLISDNYLKSADCMLRGLHALQELSRAGRVLPVIVDGVVQQDGQTKSVPTTFEKITDVIQYMNHWQEEYLEQRKRKRQAPKAEESDVNAQLSIIRSVSTEIGEFLRFLRGIDYFPLEQLQEEKYHLFFEITGNLPLHATYTSLPEETAVLVEEEVLEANGSIEISAIPGMNLLADRPSPVSELPENPLANALETEVEDVDGDLEDVTDELDDLEELASVPTEKDTDELEEHYKAEASPTDESEEEILQSIFEEEDEDDEEEEEEDSELPQAAKGLAKADLPVFEEEEDEDDQEEDDMEIDLSEEPSSFDSVESMLESELFTSSEPSMEEARDLLRKGELLAGLDVMKQMVDKAPKNANLRLQYANALIQHSTQHEDASKELRKVLELEPNSAEAYESMGKIAEQRNDLSLAKTFYEKAASIDEHLPGIFFKLGILSANYSQDAPKLTAKYFKRAVREEPDNVAAVYQLGILYYEKLDKPEKAAKYFLRTLELDAKHPFANYDLALLYHKMGDRLTAASYYHAAYQVNPELKTPNNDLAFAVHHPTPPPTASIVEEPAEEEVVDQERPVEVEKPRPVVKDAKGTVLITGATSGIGKATAELFAENRYRLILTGRRSDRLEAAQKEYAGRFGVETHLLSFDVRQPEAVQKAIDSLPEEWRQTDILINNAGLASGFDPIHEGDLADWDRMIDTNVKGLLYMTRAISPFMVERKKGHIINVCSTAGHEVYPNGNVYCATKHAVDALTKGMRLDLYKHGIRVSQVSPAHVEETEFALVRFHGDQERAKIYDDFQPLKSSDVAEVVYFMATRPAHVNIQDVLLMGKQQAGSSFIDRSGR